MSVDNGKVLPAAKLTISVKFPRGGTSLSFEDAPHLLPRFPGNKCVSLTKVHFSDNARVTIEGFGIPFAHPDDPELEAIVNDNAPIVDGISLLDVLRQRTFKLVLPSLAKHVENAFDMAKLPPSFSYPYGVVHKWDAARFSRLIEENKSTEPFTKAPR
jgi:hypothetical protein